MPSEPTLHRIDVQGFRLHTGEATFDYLKDVGVLVPVETSEYRLCAIRVDGRTKRWCFAKEATAVKHLADLELDIEQRPLCGYRDPWLEVRQVTGWERRG